MIHGTHINMYPTVVSSSIVSFEGHMDTKFKVHGPHIIILEVINENETINLCWNNFRSIFIC